MAGIFAETMIDSFLLHSQSTAAQVNMQRQIQEQLAGRLAAEVAQRVKFDMQQNNCTQDYTLSAYLPMEQRQQYVYRTASTADLSCGQPASLPKPPPTKAKILSWNEFYRQLKKEINEWLDMGEF